MLSSINIKNLAIIKALELNLEPGLIVLTGETGAGKSIILDGINLLIGEKIGTEMIRSEENSLSAEGVFSVKGDVVDILEELDIECEESEIIVRRELDRSGKNKITVNGSRVNAATLKSIMENVVDLVGQHSHQMLLEKRHHKKLVDSFFSPEDLELAGEIEKVYSEIIDKRKKIEEIINSKREMEEKKELFEFQLNELREAELKPGEQEELELEYKRLFNAGRIIETLTKSIEALKEGEANALSMIAFSRGQIDSVAKFGEEYETLSTRINELYYLTGEIVNEIEESISDIEVNEQELKETADRLDKIKKIVRKYGKSIPELIDYAQSLEEKLSQLDKNEYNEKLYEKELVLLEKKYIDFSKKIGEKRRKIATDIEYKIIDELKSLNMKGIRFKVSFEEKEGIFKDGNDNIEFLIATNVGEELKPLSKIVSGGEVSRIMLAVKSIFAAVDNISLLIFDEIDTGIGGETLRKVADKLKALSKDVQVICITHSPSIAALADVHLFIEKHIEEGKTVTNVSELSLSERVNEIARMIAGDGVTESVMKHSEELIKEGKKWIMRK